MPSWKDQWTVDKPSFHNCIQHVQIYSYVLIKYEKYNYLCIAYLFEACMGGSF